MTVLDDLFDITNGLFVDLDIVLSDSQVLFENSKLAVEDYSNVISCLKSSLSNLEQVRKILNSSN